MKIKSILFWKKNQFQDYIKIIPVMCYNITAIQM